MKRVVAVGLAVIVIGVGAGGFLYVHRPAAGEAIEVDLTPGMTTKQIADELVAKHVISSAFWFRLMAKVRGIDGKIEAGRYAMNRGMGVQAALDVMGASPQVKGVAITVPEGFTLAQVAARIGARTHIAAADFVAAATNGTVHASIVPARVRTLEGLLYPETYLVSDNENASDVARRMVTTFEDATSQEDWSYAEGHGLSRYQVIVMASLIEREAKVPEDRAKVAAVIYNRLARHMRLQIDATAIYDLPTHRVPSAADLRRPSPYNTYLINGLPPTPIASPGHAAIEAALHPAHIDAIFYVVCEPSGRHCFTSSAQEFQRLLARRPAETH